MVPRESPTFHCKVPEHSSHDQAHDCGRTLCSNVASISSRTQRWQLTLDTSRFCSSTALSMTAMVYSFVLGQPSIEEFHYNLDQREAMDKRISSRRASGKPMRCCCHLLSVSRLFCPSELKNLPLRDACRSWITYYSRGSYLRSV